MGADVDAMGPYLTSILRESGPEELEQTCEDCQEILAGSVEDEAALSGLAERIRAAWQELVAGEALEQSEQRAVAAEQRRQQAEEMAQQAEAEAEARRVEALASVSVSEEAEELRKRTLQAAMHMSDASGMLDLL